MVKRVFLRYFSFIIFWLVSAWFLQAEITTTVSLLNLNVLSRQEDASLAMLSGIDAELAFKAVGNRNVKGEIRVDAYLADSLSFDISRAYFKIRFPVLRLTAGKAPLSWGEGFLFNAGDVVFDGMSLNTNLAGDVLRDNTVHQLLLTHYLSRFSYVELLLLPSPKMNEIIPGIYLPEMVPIHELAEGGRIILGFSAITLEAGYLYKGDSSSHNPYFAVSGGIPGIGDYYLSSSCEVLQENFDTEKFKKSFKVSGGISTSLKPGGDESINLRLETGVFPCGEWKEVVSPVAAVNYGFYLFPEISYVPVENMSFQLRSLVSPLDGSGTVFLGSSWNVYQGLTLSCLGSCLFGDENDTFGWGRENDVLIMLTLEYIYGG